MAAVALQDYETLVAILDGGSLTEAARRTGRSVQSISRSLARLESDVGATLIRRTTRRLSPTPAGERLAARLRGALSDIDSARVEAALGAAEPSGRLRVGGPTLFGPRYLAPIAAAFVERRPAVSIDLDLSDDFRDPIAAGLDLSLRIGETADSSLVARGIGEARRVAFAAPAYLAARGVPRRPADLASHDCVVRTASSDPQRWTFGRRGASETVRVDGRFKSNNAAACIEAVAFGAGVGLASFWQILPLLDAGRVEAILVDFEPEPAPIRLVWPAASETSGLLRAFVDFVAARPPQGLG